MFKRILVANRGEIALRVIRACRELGIETVAIYSEADRGAAYLGLADEAYCVGPPRAAESYLKIDRVISAAEIGNAQAIHPGYGFLAENAHFADVCRSCKIEFIGPTPEAMALVGDKNAARSLAKQIGVPTVPGSDGLVEDKDQALEISRAIGFPVLIKASAGGGGRGMRVALTEKALESALDQAQAEAGAAFGNADIYLEKYVEHPRHVEVQVIADTHGNVVHLWERDCTMQRRHQKLIEESPAPNLDDSVRATMCEAAVRLVKAADYTNAATVEFIVDRQGNFYFIELNARIQVEHPVTELVTGIDLIKAQIRVASGEPLPFKQEDVRHQGCIHRMPHQRRGSGKELPALPGHDYQDDHSRRLRCPLRLARPCRLHGFAPLRFDDRQTAGPSTYAGRSHRLRAPRPPRIPCRRHQDHRAATDRDPVPLGLRRRTRRHHLHRTQLGQLTVGRLS